MVQLTLVLAALFNYLAPPPAAAARKPAPPAKNVRAEAKKAAPAVTKKPAVEPIKVPTADGPKEYLLTEETEIRLDGRVCKFNDVPDDAVIVRMEVDGADDKTVIRVHFRSGRK